MSLDMDTTTVAGPQVRAWELLANLAASGQDSVALHDTQSFVQHAVELMRSHLPCAWGLLLLHSIAEGPARASWGLDDDQLQELLARNGHHQPADIIEIELRHIGAPVGALLLSGSPDADAVLVPGFLQALQGQLELLIAVQRREIQHQRELATLNAASSLSLDLFGQTDLRAVLRSLIERAVFVSGAQAGAIWTIAEDGNLELMVSHGLSRDYSGISVAPGQGLAGQVLLTRTPLILDDYQQYEPRLPQFADEPFHALIGM